MNVPGWLKLCDRLQDPTLSAPWPPTPVTAFSKIGSAAGSVGFHDAGVVDGHCDDADARRARIGRRPSASIRPSVDDGLGGGVDHQRAYLRLDEPCASLLRIDLTPQRPVAASIRSSTFVNTVFGVRPDDL